jgi:hypothetical protein
MSIFRWQRSGDIVIASKTERVDPSQTFTRTRSIRANRHAVSLPAMTRHTEESPESRSLAPKDWLLCEALRRFEEQAGGLSLDDPATRRAARTEASLQQRIATRARLHPDGKRLARPIGRALSGVRFGLVALPWSDCCSAQQRRGR